MVKYKIIGIVMLCALFFISFSCNNSAENKDQANDSVKVVDTSSTSTKQLTATYQCPMKCEGEKTYAEAGKCPECEMDLAKVE